MGNSSQRQINDEKVSLESLSPSGKLLTLLNTYKNDDTQDEYRSGYCYLLKSTLDQLFKIFETENKLMQQLQDEKKLTDIHYAILFKLITYSYYTYLPKVELYKDYFYDLLKILPVDSSFDKYRIIICKNYWNSSFFDHDSSYKDKITRIIIDLQPCTCIDKKVLHLLYAKYIKHFDDYFVTYGHDVYKKDPELFCLYVSDYIKRDHQPNTYNLLQSTLLYVLEDCCLNKNIKMIEFLLDNYKFANEGLKKLYGNNYGDDIKLIFEKKVDIDDITFVVRKYKLKELIKS
jgi:hypothetical protein